MTFTPFHVAMCHPTPSKSKSHRPACIHVPRSTTATTSIIATPPRFDLISPNLVSNGNNHNNRDPNTITQARFTCKLNLQGPLHGGDGEEGRGSLQTKPKNPCDYGLLRKEEVLAGFLYICKVVEEDGFRQDFDVVDAGKGYCGCEGWIMQQRECYGCVWSNNALN
ncbi:hypothetical protein D0Y65_041030 [Glycine soja]|uniref:Uncharacterized protein n=1 Tax=Glycine soja TaxID=3848 RepID=A0A445GU09_GLYSO|nr:hypothetical protein D0Y65_041030 [Glycine soja]